jgi:hypothetical protein
MSAIQLDPRAPQEGLFATHDGWIWPVARAQMRSPRDMLLRMSHDIKLLREAQDIVNLQDMRDLGWRDEQLSLLAERAKIKSQSQAQSPAQSQAPAPQAQSAANATDANVVSEIVSSLASGLSCLLFIAGLLAFLMTIDPSFAAPH